MDGKLCYVMDVKKVKDLKNMKDHMGPIHGAQGGLSFVMDYNYLSNMGNKEDRNTAAHHLNGLAALEARGKKPEAKIYINTIEPYIGKDSQANKQILSNDCRCGRRQICNDICKGNIRD